MPEERKLVTVLFADIVGSTGDLRAHDAEIVRQTLGAAFGEMREICPRSCAGASAATLKSTLVFTPPCRAAGTIRRGDAVRLQ